MKQKGLALGVFLLICLPFLAYSNYRVVDGPKDFYFGHISYTEIKNDGKDPVVFREGQKKPEVALLNLPVGPGDSIQTSDSRRCEIQFDNGTIVRLDLNTELKIETILAPSLSTAKMISNLLLGKGQVYVMYKKYNSFEIFQIMTQGAAVKLNNNTVALIKAADDGSTDVQVEQGKAQVLYGPDRDQLKTAKIEKLQRLVVAKNHQAQPASYVETEDFKSWNKSINENFAALHEESFLPKPVQNLPNAVFDFAQKFGNRYGEWIWHDLYGYVWRPFYNDYYPWGNWQPYYYGSWAEMNGQLFWVPDEPWGWIPYHLGIWTWDKKKGWLWMPGSLFAPAWAVWDFYFGYYAWRPYSLWDWYYRNPYGIFWGTGGSPQFDPLPKQILNVIRKDQLKQKHDAPALPMPKEIKKVFNAAVARLKKGDATALESLEGVPKSLVAVKKEDLYRGSVPEKAIKLEDLSRQLAPRQKEAAAPVSSQEVHKEVVKTFQRERAVNNLREHVASILAGKSESHPGVPSEIRAPGVIAAPVPTRGNEVREGRMRILDWNPDVKAALRMGVDVTYSSRTNSVESPQLGISSRQLNSWRHSLSPMGSPSFSGGGSSGSGGSSSFSGGSGAGSGSREGGGESRGGGKEGK